MEHKTLTKAKFLEILKKKEATEDVQLDKVELKSGAEKGQNYSGLVVACHLEAKVKGQPKTYDWMAKVPLDDPTKFDWLRMTHMEEKELGFYQDVIPALKDFITKKGSAIQLGFCPFVYGEFNKDIPKEKVVQSSMIIMEHLGQMGFSEPVNKKSGLDLDHVKLVMKSLGEFHAASHAFYKAKYGGFENIVDKDPIQTKDYFAEIMAHFNDTLAEGFFLTFSNIGEDGHKYVESYKRFAKDVIDPLTLRDQLSGPTVCKFNVLCHGDPWFNNMMFKYDGQKPTEVCLLDLALTKWASPTIDLSYFLYMSTTPELRQAHMDEIMDYYHKCLTKSLKELGEDPSVLSLSELKADYKKCSFFGFMMSLLVLPLILAKKEDTIGSEELPGDFADSEAMEKFAQIHNDRTKVTMSNEPQIGHRISRAFLEMVDNGYFTL